jgi:putative nucleotidyltransferase with HDIG domain
MNRAQAWDLLCEFTASDSLRKHGLAVEAAMRHFARRQGENEEKWGVVGLIHDFDYEQHPTLAEHPLVGASILRERGWPEEIARAVLSHGDHTGVSRESSMEKTLFAVDELTGLITAVALVRPSKSILDVEASSVRKKKKDKAFARSVSREDIVKGAEELGADLNTHIGEVIRAMRSVGRRVGAGEAREAEGGTLPPNRSGAPWAPPRARTGPAPGLRPSPSH